MPVCVCMYGASLVLWRRDSAARHELFRISQVHPQGPSEWAFLRLENELYSTTHQHTASMQLCAAPGHADESTTWGHCWQSTSCKGSKLHMPTPKAARKGYVQIRWMLRVEMFVMHLWGKLVCSVNRRFWCSNLRQLVRSRTNTQGMCRKAQCMHPFPRANAFPGSNHIHSSDNQIVVCINAMMTQESVDCTNASLSWCYTIHNTHWWSAFILRVWSLGVS